MKTILKVFIAVSFLLLIGVAYASYEESVLVPQELFDYMEEQTYKAVAYEILIENLRQDVEYYKNRACGVVSPPNPTIVTITEIIKVDKNDVNEDGVVNSNDWDIIDNCRLLPNLISHNGVLCEGLR